jgi:hypothetical protein
LTLNVDVIDNSGTTLITLLPGNAINAYAVVIKSPTSASILNTGSPTNLAVTDSETISATTVATSISQSSSGPLSTGSAETPLGSDSGLSTSAKAGIGVGVFLGIAIIFLVGLYLGRGTIKRRQKPDNIPIPEISGSEIHMMQTPDNVLIPEISGSEIHELQP